MNKSIKLATATALLLAAAGAYAGSDDGTSDDAWLTQSQVSQTAPAPSSASSADPRRGADSGVVSPLP